MKIIGAVVWTLLVLLPVRWQPGMTATNDPKTEKVVDASGNLRVPGDYRTAYQFLGSWAGGSRPRPGFKGDPPRLCVARHGRCVPEERAFHRRLCAGERGI